MTPVVQQQPQSSQPIFAELPSILWKTAVEAAVKTFLTLLLGHIAISIIGGILHDMTPSAPPGMSFKMDKGSASAWNAWEPSLRHKGPYLLFGVFFVLLAWHRLAQGSQEKPQSKLAKRTRKVLRRFSEDWFGLIVSNAFVAMVSAMVLTWIPQFSWWQAVWHWVLADIGSAFQTAAEHVFGNKRTEGMRAWFDWYGVNQLKFNFWFLYVAAICDDLGIPNVKTLGRLLWRRFRKRMRSPQPVSAPAKAEDSPESH